MYVLLPLMMGFCYYYIYCPDIIVIKMLDSILGAGYHLHIEYNWVTRLIRFYLLDAIWAFALTHCIFIILGCNIKALKWSMIIATVISVSMELLQMYGLAIGTFDVYDIMVEIIAIFIALIIMIKQLKGEKENEKESN